jgi:hypothetical protein
VQLISRWSPILGNASPHFPMQTGQVWLIQLISFSPGVDAQLENDMSSRSAIRQFGGSARSWCRATKRQRPQSLRSQPLARNSPFCMVRLEVNSCCPVALGYLATAESKQLELGLSLNCLK